jgi:alkaline phosphatase D
MHLRAFAQRFAATRRALACAAWAVFACAAIDPAEARLVIMHGHAELTSVMLWAQSDRAGPVTIAWRADGQANERTIELNASEANDYVVVARLSGLAPGRSAAYRVAAGDDVREGVVRAQPYWSKARDAPDLAIALGSCFFLADPDPTFGGQDYGGGFGTFQAIADKKPDVMLWLGDNLYLQQPDFYDPDSMAARYRRQRAFEPLQSLLTATTHLAIWDDHDFGPNDSDTSYTFKAKRSSCSRATGPIHRSDFPDVAGAFGIARYGDVTFFLLDDRYYRSPDLWPDGPDKTMFGARQLEWLKQALVSAPRNAIKIIAGGSQFWNRPHRFEGWHQFATEQRAFAEWLVARRIDGVLFVSGDRHFSELLKIDRPGAYPLYEFTSSPLTSRPPARVDQAEQDNPDVVPGTLVAKRQFGMIRVSGPGERSPARARKLRQRRRSALAA